MQIFMVQRIFIGLWVLIFVVSYLAYNYTVEPLKTNYVRGQRNQPVFRGTGFMRFRKQTFTFFQCVIFVIVFKCVLNKNKYCRNLFYKCVHVLSVKSTTRFQVTDLIGFVACCRIFFMLYKNHRARCSNNGIQYSIQLMTLLTEMIPETTGVKIRLNTKRPHTKKQKQK